MEPMSGVIGAGQEVDDAQLMTLKRRMERHRIARMEREAEQRKRGEAAMVVEEVDMVASRLGAQGFFDVPASSEAILALPVPMLSETKDRGCAVCYHFFVEGDQLRMMPCSHTFHQSCIFKRLCVNGACPCCGLTMPAAEDLFDSQDLFHSLVSFVWYNGP